MFGSSSLVPPLVGGSGGKVCESVKKAGLLSDDFESKQSRESVDLHSLDIRRPVFQPMPSVRVRLGVSR